MQKRILILAMVLFLITGIMSATVCEMTCIPANHSAACCPDALTHRANSASITSAHQCGHPQEESAVAITVAQSLQTYAIADLVPIISPLPGTNLTAGVHQASVQGGLKRSLLIPPLRI